MCSSTVESPVKKRILAENDVNSWIKQTLNYSVHVGA